MQVQTKRVLSIVLILVCSAAARVWYHTTPGVSLRQPLEKLPRQMGAWTAAQDHIVPASQLAILKADDYLLRTYRNPEGKEGTLFIAFYKVQRAGEAMHSPRNCLPGWGWTAVRNDRVPMNPDDPSNPLMINRFVVEKDQERALVLYWYEAHQRVVASEYTGKVLLVLDALKTNRREGSIIRVTLPLYSGQSIQDATAVGVDLARGVHEEMKTFLP